MNCVISVVIIVWDGYFFHDEIVADRKVDVLVATKMSISSIGVHSLMRVWNV